MSGARRLMLMSVRPRFVDALLDGRKTVELRRTRPLVYLDQPVAIYATVPVAAVVALATITRVRESSPTAIWEALGPATGIPRREFREYYRGSRSAVAIQLDDVRALDAPVSLETLRSRGPFQPPQTWHFLEADDVRRLLGQHQARDELIKAINGVSPSTGVLG